MEARTTYTLYFGDGVGDLDEAADVSERLGYSEMMLVRGIDGTVRGETRVPPRELPGDDSMENEGGVEGP